MVVVPHNLKRYYPDFALAFGPQFFSGFVLFKKNQKKFKGTVKLKLFKID